MKNNIYISILFITFFIKSNIYSQKLVPDCTETLAVDAMHSSNITATSVDLSWLLVTDKLTNSGAVEIIYGISGFDVTNSLNKITTTSANTITISNLTPNTSYDFYIKLVCQDDKLWSGPTRVKTLDSIGVICFPEKLANNFTAKAISPNTIELNFGILKDSDFLLGIAYGPQGSVNLNDPLTFTRTKADSKAGTTLIHGLKPSTNYEFYIKLNCQSDDLFVGPVVQSTASDLVVDCPTSKIITSFNTTDINSSWVSFSWEKTVKDLNISIDANKYVIVYGLEGFSIGGGSATSRSLRTGNESRVVVNEPKATITSLQSRATYDFYIKLACQADEFLVGPFKIQTSGLIDPIAECPVNKVIDINNFISKSDLPNSVELKWLTDNNTGFQFEIAYGIKGTVNLNDFNTYKKATVFDTNANRIVIDNLLADTEYEFYLKAVCQSKDLYVGPIVQRTVPDAIIDCVPKLERNALIDLYNATNGANWTNKWDLTKPVCDWYGITVFDGKVKEISLLYNNLEGNIPSSIGNLSNLYRLSISSNKLSGSIPTEIGNLSLLNYLNFLNNSLTGEIPRSIKNLTYLQELSLGGNQLSGAIPEEISTLISLRRLSLDRNLLTGVIPSSLGNLINLNSLGLGTNKLTGQIPLELSNLTRLTRLYLNNNGLSGVIPSNLGKLSNMQYFILYNNQLTGEIPSELGNLSKLIRLQLHDNLLTGTIPPNLGSLSNLTGLYLNGNKLTGTIPSELENLSKLETISIHENMLEGNFPFSIDKCPNLDQIRISNNRFVFNDFESAFSSYSNSSVYFNYHPQEKIDQPETLSVEIGKSITLSVSTKLKSLNNRYQWYKYHVAIDGETNKELVIENATKADEGAYYYRVTNSVLPTLTLTRNTVTIKTTEPVNICGVSETEKQALIDLYNSTNGANWTNTWDLTKSVCEWYGITVVEGKVTKISLNANNLDGQLLNSIGQLSNLEHLELFNNKISGNIPTEIGNLSSLKILYLSQNLLTGEIPITIGNLLTLEKLLIDSNQLTGSIPLEIGNLSSLNTLSLYKNSLTGEIPSSIGDLSKLEGMWLSENRLTGEIPVEIGNLSLLRGLNFSSNSLTGQIPTSVKNLLNLDHIYLNGNKLSGSIPAELGVLPNLRQIVLGSNLLTGQIPATLGKLSNLEILWLNGNQLTGQIPVEIGNLTNLMQLYLDSNKLTGNIPQALGNLSNLEFIRLSDNQLKGEVPFSVDNAPNLKRLWIRDNKFVFTNIEDNFIIYQNLSEGFNYSPQAKVDATEALSVELGKNITLTSTALTSPNNSYQWYKDGIAISGATNKEYVIANATTTNAGVYHFTATNSIVTDLTLTRNPITVKVTEPVDPICFPEKLAANFIAETVSSSTIELDFGTLKNSDLLLEIAYGVQGTVSINDPLTFTRITADSKTGGTLITGLKPSTHYEFYIKLKCQSDNLFSGPVVQHTGAEPIDPTCPIQPITSTPQTFSVKGVSSSSIEIRWGDNVKESHDFEIAYGEATSFNINDINTYNTVTSDVTVRPILINNLKPSTLYSFYIKAACQEHSFYIKIADGKTLDDATTECPKTKVIESFKITNIQSSSVSFSWESTVESLNLSADLNKFEVVYGLEGFSIGGGGATSRSLLLGNESRVVVNEPKVTISGLQSQATYDFYIKLVCQGDEFLVGPFKIQTSGIIDPIPDCPTEKITVKLSAESRTSSSIEVIWSVGGAINNDFEIAYGKSLEVNLNNPVTYKTVKVSTQRGSTFITGLEASTNYKFYIKYQCQNNDLYVGPVEQHTLAGSGGGCSNQQYSLSALDITNSSVKLIWSQLVRKELALIEDEISELEKSSYTIKYGFKGFKLDSFEQLGEFNTTERQLLVSGLKSGGIYDFYLIKNCVGGNLVVGPKTVAILDGIDPNCSHHKIASGPGSFLAHGMSPERVRILWKFGVDASQPLKVAYGKTGIIDLTNPHTYKTVTTLPNAIDVNIYGLEASTSYTFYIKAECQSNDLYVGPVEATTLSNLIDIDIDIEAIKATPGTSFRPMYEKRYVVSGWVKENNNDGKQQATYKNSAIRLYTIALEGGKLSDPVLINDFYAKGEVIDGWQRIEEVFVIKTPDNGELTPNNLIIELVNKSSETTSYFDDVRIFPFNASIKSFVYDNKTKKLMAELDENNYATYYEYDKEGGLVRVKKETSKGVYTIQETRSSNAKN